MSERGFLPGVFKGLGITMKTMARPAVTHEYPDARPDLPPRSRGVIALVEENCTSCMLCARECPDWCIYIEGHKETIPATTPGGRERQRNVLDRFAIDYALCMYCGICVEVCPFDALYWSPQFEYAEFDIQDLLHEKERLGQWVQTVPVPPALDERAPDAAEVVSANKPPRVPRPAAAAGDATGAVSAAGEAPVRRERPAGGDRPARAERPAPEAAAGAPTDATTDAATPATRDAEPAAPPEPPEPAVPAEPPVAPEEETS